MGAVPGSATRPVATAPRRPAARAQPAPGSSAIISAIRVVGNERIESGTILSYMLVAPGDPANPDLIDRSLKTLYATGLFSDVSINREGARLGGEGGGKPAGEPGGI